MSKIFPKDITSYDLLKTFAVVTMIIDHVGSYFYPDYAWIRVVGRMSFPVWLFLIGYARTREIPPKLLIGGAILVIANWVVGMPILALNILLSIAFVRLVLDKVMAYSARGVAHLWFVSAFLFILIIPTYMIFEYGTQALIFGIFGYLVRHREGFHVKDILNNYMIFTVFGFVVMQALSFGFDKAEVAALFVVTCMVVMGLSYFKSAVYPRLTKAAPNLCVWFVQLCGRRALEIYVVHLLVFKFVALYLGMEGFSLFELQWIDLDAFNLQGERADHILSK